jgi:hypothetical protein
VAETVPVKRDTNDTLEEILTRRKVPTRDCRNCPRFVPDEQGLRCGWCEAHEMWVKLYAHPQRWYSQCQFRTLRAERAIVS